MFIFVTSLLSLLMEESRQEAEVLRTALLPALLPISYYLNVSYFIYFLAKSSHLGSYLPVGMEH